MANRGFRELSTSLRRRQLLGAAALGGGAAFVAACGGAQQSRTGSQATPNQDGVVGRIATAEAGLQVPGANETPKRGGTMIINIGSLRILDPHLQTLLADTFAPTNVYNGLLKATPDTTGVLPELAQALPEQPDPLTYVFKLRQGVKWHNVAPANGREFVAEDVKFSVERQMTKDPRFTKSYFFTDAITSIETPDKYTVRMKVNKPYAPFINYTANPYSMMVNREVVEADGDATRRLVGTGPFMFEEWQRDVAIRLRRNPDYWGKDKNGGALPYVDALVGRIATDPNTIQAQFGGGDILAAPIDFNFVEEIRKKLPKANYRSVTSQFWRQIRTSPYDEARGTPHRRPWTDIRVRQAFVESINKKEVLDLVYSGDGVVVNGPILPIFPFWALKEDPVKFDPANARRLLEAAGFANGFDTEMIFSNAGGDIPNQIAEVVKVQLGKTGIRLKLTPMENTAYFNKTYAFDYETSHHPPLNSAEPDENLASYFGAGSTFFRWGNKEIHGLIARQSEILDNNERQKLVLDIQRRVALDYPMNFTLSPNTHLFTNPKVKGWFYSVDRYDWRMESVWIDPSA
jgi:peptide/nickel transport system substrate-binding protein